MILVLFLCLQYYREISVIQLYICFSLKFRMRYHIEFIADFANAVMWIMLYWVDIELDKNICDDWNMLLPYVLQSSCLFVFIYLFLCLHVCVSLSVLPLYLPTSIVSPFSRSFLYLFSPPVSTLPLFSHFLSLRLISHPLFITVSFIFFYSIFPLFDILHPAFTFSPGSLSI